MSILTLEGFVENGQIRLVDQVALPENARVYVVVPHAPDRTPRVRSPRLADPAQAAAFFMQVAGVGRG